LIGFFVNILPLRVDLSGDPTPPQMLQRVKTVALDGYEHQSLPFEYLLNALQLQRDNSQAPLVPIVVRHQNFPEVPVHSEWAEGLQMRPLPPSPDSTGIAKSELDMQFYGAGAELSVVVEYAADLFKPSTVERILLHHEQVLEQLVTHPELPLTRIAIMTATEQHRMLTEWNATERSLEESFDRLLEEIDP
jgi:non-ribosomal peptide synthetase component F